MALCMSFTMITPSTQTALAATKTFTYAEQTTGEKVTSLEMQIGEKVDLKFNGISNWKTYTYKWVSSNSKVAVVDSAGVITALGIGVATIRLTVSGGDGTQYTSTGVTVYVGKEQDFTIGTFNKKALEYATVEMGNTISLKANGVPNGYICTWSSTNAHIAKIDNNGKVTPVATGLTVIQLTATNSKNGEVLSAVPIALQVTSKDMMVTETPTPNPTFTPTPTPNPKNMVIIEMADYIPAEYNRYSSSGKLWTSMVVSDMTYECEANRDGTYDVDMFFAGEKTYDYENGTNACYAIWKLYDEDGYVVEDGEVFVNNLEVGDKFKGVKNYIYNLAPGKYYLTLCDDGVASANTSSGTEESDKENTLIYNKDLHIGIVCAVDYAYEYVKFPNSMVFTNIYFAEDNGAGHNLWLLEGYADNSFGGKSYFYIHALRRDEAGSSSYYVNYKIGESDYILVSGASENPYRFSMGMFKKLDTSVQDILRAYKTTLDE